MYGLNLEPLTPEEREEHIIKTQREFRETMNLGIKAFLAEQKKEADELAELNRLRYGK